MSQVQVVDFESAKPETSYCIDLHTRDRNIAENTARITERVKPGKDHNKKIAVVCYGPSLEDTWEELRNFKYIITCSGAHKFLLDRGIIPTYHAEVDPRPHKAELIGTPHKDVQYLVASLVHRDVLDLLEGYDVKLWHVYAHETMRKDVPHTFARGEWALTGGTNVGLRCLVLARFLGFKRVALYGMDYSFKQDGTQHAGWHPKEFASYLAIEADGETFYTNPAMLSYAQSFFHETRQLGFTEFEVKGTGLMQAKIREQVKKDPKFMTKQTHKGMLAAQSPMVISPDYLALNQELHQTNPSYGISGSKRADVVEKIVAAITPQTILDYGAGKGTLAKALPFPIWEYDPAIPGKEQPPRAAELVVCTDVLEHVEPELLPNVLLDLKRVTLRILYVVINTGAAVKTLPDGRNAHLIQQPLEWWQNTLTQYFDIGKIGQVGNEITAILSIQQNKPKAQPEAKAQTSAVAPPDISARITPTRHKGTEIRFHTPNQVTEWRARSLFSKEPATIEWIESFRENETLYDVGANVGGYSVWAAKRRGVKTVSFEPEAENYALLVKNLSLNEIPADAYCLALTDKPQIGSLHLSKAGAGGSCHSFAEPVGPDLKPRKYAVQQGCVGVTLDELVEQGLPAPDHLKIDVDGFEYKVIKGAEHVLSNGLKSLLVEVNPALDEHQEMLKYLANLGYEYDPTQVAASTRKEGPFKGVAEYVFRRPSELEKHLIERLEAAEVVLEPYPHLWVDSALPSVLYARLMDQLPPPKQYQPIAKVRKILGKGYPKRFVSDPKAEVWTETSDQLRAGAFRRALCKKFGIEDGNLTDETLLIRDKPGYKIGPHTDMPLKVMSALFYLRGCDGTSLYVPKEEGFTCKGGPHHSFTKFNKVKTAPFKPNSLFVFLKTSNSFHGVEPTKAHRDVLLYDIRRKQ